MKKKHYTFFILIMFSLMLFQFDNSLALTDDEANENIREVITSGIYTAGNLNVDFKVDNLDSNILLERSTRVANLIEFRTGDSVITSNSTVDRVAFLTFQVEGNVGTTYNIDSAYSTLDSSRKEVEYMKIAGYDENWLHQNIDIVDTRYNLKYNDYDIVVKSVLGFDGTIPIDINFDVSDYIPTDTIMNDGDIFRTTGMLAVIDSVSVSDTILSFKDSSSAVYQMSPLSTMPSNVASDLDSDDYKSEEEAPEEYRRVSFIVENAGLISGSESTSYKSTYGDTGRSAQLYCQNGDLSSVGGLYQLRLKAVPQVQTLQQTFQYKKVVSARDDWISIEEDKGETGEYPYASLRTETITRVLGAEVYNVNVHFTMNVVVKLLVSTEFIPLIQIVNASDSIIHDEIEYESGDEYWDNSLEQEVGDFLFATTDPITKFFDRLGNIKIFGVGLNTIFFLVIGIAVFILIMPYAAPFIMPLISTVSSMINVNANNKNRKRR